MNKSEMVWVQIFGSIVVLSVIEGFWDHRTGDALIQAVTQSDYVWVE